jgi:hypothetical protein
MPKTGPSVETRHGPLHVSILVCWEALYEGDCAEQANYPRKTLEGRTLACIYLRHCLDEEAMWTVLEYKAP